MPPPGRALLLAALVAAAATASPSPLAAQLVRGTVTQAASGAPIAGVLVELLAADSAGPRVASALTDVAGAFALRAPAPGRYVLAAKRIGVRRVTSPPFLLAAGETRTIPVVLEAVEYRLPEVVVTANRACAATPGDSARVIALWDEARTALDAAEISLRDRLFTAQVSRYVRELEPGTLRVLRETTSDVRGAVASPFGSPPPESLATAGYWRVGGDGRTTYHGPDARTILSDEFLGDHCFHPVTGQGARRGLVGLAFAPRSDRGVPEVRGTLWLDGRSLELQLVEFTYDRLATGTDTVGVGGELHFARLPGGAWIVRRWYLRVPANALSTQPLSTEGSAPWVLVRPTTARLREEGGVVTPDELRPALRLAAIEGTVRDSTRKRPLRGAVVALGGSSRSATADSSGRFRLDDVTPGAYQLLVRASGYDTLGVAAVERSVGPGDGEQLRLTLDALDTRALTTRLCGGRAAAWGRGTLHVTVRDSASGATRPGVQGTLRWMSTTGRDAGDSVAVTVQATSDANGHLTFCDVASGRALTLQLRDGAAGTGARLRTMIPARAVRHFDVSLAPAPG